MIKGEWHVFTVGIYKKVLHFVVGGDTPWLQRETVRRGLKMANISPINTEDSAAFTYTVPNSNNIMIWLKLPPTTPYALGLLSHEALHTTRAILENFADTPLSDGSEEPYCYLLQHIVQCCLEEFRGKGKGKK